MIKKEIRTELQLPAGTRISGSGKNSRPHGKAGANRLNAWMYLQAGDQQVGQLFVKLEIGDDGKMSIVITVN